MNIKLTLGERLKDLRVERNLKLEALGRNERVIPNRHCRLRGDDGISVFMR